jgi:hypothetical protein
MSWREELRGVRRADLAGLGLVITGLVWAGIALPQETQVPAEEYKAVWDWCGVRWPFRKDLQDACRTGAYEMLPGQEAPADERMQDA